MSFQLSISNKILDHCKKLSSLPIGFRQAGFMFMATSLGSALNYLVHFATSRMLGPADYGVFASLNSFYTLISVPLGILTMVTAYYLARFQARGEVHRSGSLLIAISKWAFLIGVLAGAVIALGSPFLAAFLQIPTSTPILVVAAIILVGALMPVMTGALQGLQNFLAFGINSIIGPFLRLAFAVCLVALGFGVIGALSALFFSGLVTIGIALVFLAPLIRRSLSRQQYDLGLTLKEVLAYAGLVLIGTTCLASLTNMDVIIVKHYFSPAEAGQFAAASVLAKVILFFPNGLIAVLFPKAAERFALQQDSSKIARQAAVAIAGLCGGIAVIYFLIPDFLIRLLFGQGYEFAVPLIGYYGATMVLYALVTLQMTYYLSIHKTQYIPFIAGSTLLQAAALLLLHRSLLVVIIIQLISSGTLLVVSEISLRGIISRTWRPEIPENNRL